MIPGGGASLGTARGEIQIAIDQAISSLERLGGALNSFEGKAQSTGLQAGAAFLSTQNAIMQTGRLLTGLGAAAATPLVGAIKVAADFDQALANIAAVGGKEARDMMTEIHDEALRLGSATTFSAREAAAGMEELIRAGQDVQTVVGDGLGGAAQGALDLAAAAGITVPQAAEIMGTSLNVFGESLSKDFETPLEQSIHIADVFAAAANTSAADVEGLGASLSQVGNTAAQNNVTFEETVGLLAALADQGIKGSDAGTLLRTFFTRVTAPGTKATEMLEKYNIATRDLAGELLPVPELAQNMIEAFEKMTPAEQDAFAQTVFGVDAQRALNAMVALGSEGINEYVDAVNVKGAAEEAAEARTNSLTGDVEKLGSAYEKASILVGEQFVPVARDVVQAVTGIVTAFADAPPAVQAVATAFAAFTAGALLAAGGALLFAGNIRDSIVALRALAPALAAFRASALAALSPLLLIAAAIAALGVIAFKTNFLGFGDAVKRGAKIAGDAISRFGKTFKEVFDADRAVGMSGIAAAVAAFGHALDEALGIDVSEFFRDLALNLDEVVQKIGAVKDRFAEVFSGNIEHGFSPIVAAIAATGEAIDEAFGTDVSDEFREFAERVRDAGDAFRSSFDARTAGGATGFAAAIGAVGSALGVLTGLPVEGFFENLATAVDDAAEVFTNLRESGVDVLPAAIRAVGAAMTSLTGIDFSQAARGVASFVGQIGQLLDAVVSGDFARVGFLVGEMANQVIEALGTVDVGEIAVNIGQFVLGNIVQPIGDFIGGLLGTLEADASAAAAAGVNVREMAVNIVSWGEVNILQPLAAFLSGFFGGGGANSMGGPGERGEAGTLSGAAANGVELHDVAVNIVSWGQVNILQPLGEFLSALFGGGTSAAGRANAGAMGGEISGAEQAGINLNGLVVNILSWAAGEVDDIVAFILDTILNDVVIPLVGWTLNVGVPATVNGLQSIGEFIKLKLGELGTQVTNFTQWVLEVGRPFAGEALGSIGDWIGEKVAAAGLQVTNFTQWLLEIGNPFDSELVADIGEFLRGALAKGVVEVTNFTQWALEVGIPLIGDVVGNIADAIRPALARAVIEVTNFTQWALEVGVPLIANFVGSLVEKITEAISNPQQAVLNFTAWTLEVGIPQRIAALATGLNEEFRSALEGAAVFVDQFTGWQLEVAIPGVGNITVDASGLGDAITGELGPGGEQEEVLLDGVPTRITSFTLVEANVAGLNSQIQGQFSGGATEGPGGAGTGAVEPLKLEGVQVEIASFEVTIGPDTITKAVTAFAANVAAAFNAITEADLGVINLFKFGTTIGAHLGKEFDKLGEEGGPLHPASMLEFGKKVASAIPEALKLAFDSADFVQSLNPAQWLGEKAIAALAGVGALLGGVLVGFLTEQEIDLQPAVDAIARAFENFTDQVQLVLLRALQSLVQAITPFLEKYNELIASLPQGMQDALAAAGFGQIPIEPVTEAIGLAITDLEQHLTTAFERQNIGLRADNITGGLRDDGVAVGEAAAGNLAEGIPEGIRLGSDAAVAAAEAELSQMAADTFGPIPELTAEAAAIAGEQGGVMAGDEFIGAVGEGIAMLGPVAVPTQVIDDGIITPLEEAVATGDWGRISEALAAEAERFLTDPGIQSLFGGVDPTTTQIPVGLDGFLTEVSEEAAGAVTDTTMEPITKVVTDTATQAVVDGVTALPVAGAIGLAATESAGIVSDDITNAITGGLEGANYDPISSAVAEGVAPAVSEGVAQIGDATADAGAAAGGAGAELGQAVADALGASIGEADFGQVGQALGAKITEAIGAALAGTDTGGVAGGAGQLAASLGTAVANSLAAAIAAADFSQVGQALGAKVTEAIAQALASSDTGAAGAAAGGLAASLGTAVANSLASSIAGADFSIVGQAIGTKITEAVTAGLANTGGAAEGAGAAAADIGSALASALATSITGADFSAVGAAIGAKIGEAVTTGLSAEGGQAAGQAAGAAGGIGAALATAIATAITSADFTAVGTALGFKINEAITIGLAAGGETTAGGVGTAIAAAVAASVQGADFGAVGAAIVQGIGSGIGGAVGELQAAIGAAVQAAVAGATQAATSATSVGSALVTSAASGVGGATGTFVAAAQAMAAAGISAATTAAAAAGPVGTSFVTAAGAGIGGATGTFQAAVGAMVTAGIATGTQTASGATAIGEAVSTNAAAGITDELSGAVASMVTAAIEAGVEAAGGASAIGAAISSGAASGVILDALAGPVAEMVNRGIQAGMDAAAAASPSKKMMQLGEWLSEGAAIGVEKAGPDVVETTTAVFEEAMGAAAGAIEAAEGQISEIVRRSAEDATRFGAGIGSQFNRGIPGVETGVRSLEELASRLGKIPGLHNFDEQLGQIAGNIGTSGDEAASKADELVEKLLDKIRELQHEGGKEAKAAGKTVGTSTASGLSSTVPAAESAGQSVGEAAGTGIEEGLEDREAAIQEKVEQIVGEATSAAEAMLSGITQVGRPDVRTGEGLLGDLGKIKDDTDQLEDLANRLGKIPGLHNFDEMLSNIAGNIRGHQGEATGAAKEMLTLLETIMKEQGRALEQVSRDMGKAITDSLTSAISESAPEAKRDGEKLGRAAGQGVEQGGGVAEKAAAEAGTSTGDSLESGIEDACKPVNQQANELTDECIPKGLTSGTKESVEAADTAGEKTGDSLTDSLQAQEKPVQEGAEQVGESAGDGVIGAVNNLHAEITKAVEQATGDATNIDLTQEGVEVGESFMDGVIKGIKNKEDDVNKAAGDATKGAEKGARDKGKAHSPSLLFAEIGEDLALGMVKGLDDTLTKVEQAGSRMTEAVEKGLGPRSMDSLIRRIERGAMAAGINFEDMLRRLERAERRNQSATRVDTGRATEAVQPTEPKETTEQGGRGDVTINGLVVPRDSRAAELLDELVDEMETTHVQYYEA